MHRNSIFVVPANPPVGFMSSKLVFRTAEIDGVKMVSVFDIIRHLVGSQCNNHLFWVTVADQNPALKASVKNHERQGKFIDARHVVTLLNAIPGEAAARFRKFSAGELVRSLGGNNALVAEIDVGRIDALDSTVGGSFEAVTAKGDDALPETEDSVYDCGTPQPSALADARLPVTGNEDPAGLSPTEGESLKRKRAYENDEWDAIQKASVTAGTINLNIQSAERAVGLLERCKTSGLGLSTRCLMEEAAVNVLTSLVKSHRQNA